MKKIIFPLLISIFIFSCDNKENIPTEPPSSYSKEVVYNGFDVRISSEFPDSVASLKYTDLQRIAESSNKNSRTSNNQKDFWEIFESVKKKYPDVNNFDPKDYIVFFPKMSIDEIIKNQEDVLSFVESLIGYETAVEYSKNGSGYLDNKSSSSKISSASSSSPSGPNSCEAWYFAGHARIDISGARQGRDEALQLTSDYYGTVSDHTLPNSFQHAVGAVLIGKYGVWRYRDVWKARDVLEGLLEAHECHNDQDQKNMDFHNNRVGVKYYEAHAERYKEGFLNHNVRLTKTPTEIANYMFSTPAVKIFRGSPVTASSNTRVYFD